MSGWPSPDRTDDRRLAEALAIGDGDALPQIFDGHAARLYDYCHALLRDQELAAAALYESFLAASEHIGRLRRPELFRSWLYALVRNECLRRLHDPERPAEHGHVMDPRTGEVRPRAEAPEVEEAFLDDEERARRQETRQLVHSALSGLSGRQREALDLLLRHNLDPQEIAGVLGMAEQEAAELAEEARGRLDDALAAAVIARTGRAECPSVAALVDTWEWPLTPVVCRKVIRHIETCPTCTERRHRTVSTPHLLQVLPVAMLPADLRGQVLTAALLPEWAAERAGAAERAEPLDELGWPMPAEQPGHRAAGRDRSMSAVARLWPAVAAAAMVVAVVSGAFVLLPSAGDSPAAKTSPKVAPSSAETGPADPPEESPEPEESPTPSPSRSTPSPETSTPTPEDTDEPTTAPPSKKPTKAPGPPGNRPGSLVASGCSIPADAQSCTVTITARGGPVRWSVRSASGVSAGGSGTLRSGWSAGVQATRPAACTGQGGAGSVSFSPSGTAGVTWTCPDPDDGGAGAGH